MYYVWNLSFHSAHNFNFIFFFLLFIISPLVRSLFFIRNMKFDSDIRLFFTPKKKNEVHSTQKYYGKKN